MSLLVTLESHIFAGLVPGSRTTCLMQQGSSPMVYRSTVILTSSQKLCTGSGSSCLRRSLHSMDGSNGALVYVDALNAFRGSYFVSGRMTREEQITRPLLASTGGATPGNSNDELLESRKADPTSGLR